MKNIRTINTLHIDIENGYGGSSRSLSYLIKTLNVYILNLRFGLQRKDQLLREIKKWNNLMAQ